MAGVAFDRAVKRVEGFGVQGPVERWFGLSHLVVHTSGTHNSTVTLPGLHADLAAAMRETIRRHIQTDFA